MDLLVQEPTNWNCKVSNKGPKNLGKGKRAINPLYRQKNWVQARN